MLKEIDRLLSSRTFLKVISLLMAIAIWYYVASDRTSETVRTFSFPIEYLNAPAEYAINSNVRNVEVQVAASRELFLSEKWSEITCQADLKGLGPGKHIVPVKVILPSGFKLINISPVSMEVNIIKTQSKDVPVRLKLLGELPPEYTLEEVKMEPEKITIKGPEDIIRDISEAYVEARFEMLKDRNTLVLPVRVKTASAGSELLMEPPKVTMNYVLTKGTPKKTVPISVDIEGKLDQDYNIKSITIEPDRGVVEGPMDTIGAIKEIVVPVNLEGLKKSTVLNVPLPENYKGAKIKAPNMITVNLTIEPKIVRHTYENVLIAIKGKSIYPSWRVKPEIASVTVEGLPSVVEDEHTLPVELYVDVTNLVSTELRVPLQYKALKPQVKVISIEPSTVTVFANME